jgi:hypothetical protein
VRPVGHARVLAALARPKMISNRRPGCRPDRHEPTSERANERNWQLSSPSSFSCNAPPASVNIQADGRRDRSIGRSIELGERSISRRRTREGAGANATRQAALARRARRPAPAERDGPPRRRAREQFITCKLINFQSSPSGLLAAWRRRESEKKRGRARSWLCFVSAAANYERARLFGFTR